MNPQLLLLILKAHWRLAAAVSGLVFAGAVALGFLLPRSYTAEATVLADPKAPDPVYGLLAPGANVMAPGYISTQIEIITSERVGLRVVHTLSLEKDAQARDMWMQDGGGKGTLEQYWADRLGKGLEVKPSKDSSIIAIHYTAPNATAAAAIANAFAHTYVEVSSELRADPAKETAEFYDARIRRMREDLIKAQTQLSTYQQEHGIAAADERLDVENARLAEISSQVTSAHAVRLESASRHRQAVGSTVSSPDVLQNPVVAGLRSDIARSEAKLQELGKQLGTAHPQYQAAQAELDALRQKLQAEMQAVAGSMGTADAVNVQREAELEKALEAQKQKVLALRAQHDEIAVLQMNVTEAQRAYDQAAQRLMQSSLESQNRQASVVMLSEALAPVEPSAPRFGRILVEGAILGMILALGAAVGVEFLNRKVRGVEDAAQLYGLPVVAVLPPRNLPRGSTFRIWPRRQPAAA
jgi:chain length determinant protein EpsF